MRFSTRTMEGALPILGQASRLWIVRMCTQELPVPQKPAIEMFGVAATNRDSLSRLAVILRNLATRDRVNEVLICRCSLYGLRSRNLLGRIPPSHFLSETRCSRYQEQGQNQSKPQVHVIPFHISLFGENTIGQHPNILKLIAHKYDGLPGPSQNQGL